MNVLTYGEWRDTCDTVHMLLQMMGKAKLQSMDPQPEWKQVVLDADANGFTTGLIPFGADGFEIKLNIADAEMAAMTAAGDCARFPALPACGGNPHGVEPAGDFVARNPLRA